MADLIKLFIVSFAVSLTIAVILSIPLIEENKEKIAKKIDGVLRSDGEL